MVRPQRPFLRLPLRTWDGKQYFSIISNLRLLYILINAFNRSKYRYHSTPAHPFLIYSPTWIPCLELNSLLQHRRVAKCWIMKFASAAAGDSTYCIWDCNLNWKKISKCMIILEFYWMKNLSNSCNLKIMVVIVV